jgi:hypothetical protein
MAIGVGWFTALKDLDGGLVIDKNYDGNWGHSVHSIVGSIIIPLLAILLLIVSFFAKVDGGVKWALYVFGLVALQLAFAFAAFAAPVVGALHGANALALLAVAGLAARRAAGAPAAAAAESTEATA